MPYFLANYYPNLLFFFIFPIIYFTISLFELNLKIFIPHHISFHHICYPIAIAINLLIYIYIYIYIYYLNLHFFVTFYSIIIINSWTANIIIGQTKDRTWEVGPQLNHRQLSVIVHSRHTHYNKTIIHKV